MNLTPYFKSIIDQDVASVVICNLKHEIIYMNPKAVESYHKWGGEALLGKSLMNCHNPKSKEIIEKVVAWFEEDKEHNRIHTFYNEKQAKDARFHWCSVYRIADIFCFLPFVTFII